MNRNLLRILVVLLSLLLLLAAGCKVLVGPMKADLLMDFNKYDQALQIYKEHLKTYPATADVLGKMGYAYLKTGKLDEAKAHFSKALVLEPRHSFSNLYLGMVHMKKGDYMAARSTWQNYEDEKAPLVKDEVKRLSTLALLAESRVLAQKALKEEKSLQVASRPPNSIAVSRFASASSDPELDSFSRGLAAMVISDLSKIKGMVVVERVKLQALVQEMALGQTGVVDPRSAPKVGKLLGSENLLTGTLAKGLTINTSLVKVSKGKIIDATAATVPKNKFFELPPRIANDAAAKLGVRLSNKERTAIGKPQTTSYKAVLYYGQGLEYFDKNDWSNAARYFTSSLTEDPGFMLAKEALESCPGAEYPIIWGSGGVVHREGLGAFAERAVGQALGAQSEANEAAARASSSGH